MYDIYGLKECPYCQKAKELALEEELPFMYYDLCNNRSMRARIKKDWPTVPVVYKDGELIGGYTEFAASLRESEDHNTLQKITWWWVTIVCWVFDRKEYDVRMKARQNCIDSCSL